MRPEALPFTLATLATFCTLCRGPTTPGSGRCNAVTAEWLTITAEWWHWYHNVAPQSVRSPSHRPDMQRTLLPRCADDALLVAFICRTRSTRAGLKTPALLSRNTFSMMGSTMRRRCALPTERFLRTFAQSGTDTPSSFAMSRLLAARRW